jgi:hypothetical protein
MSQENNNNPEYIEMMKKQWVAMGLDPNQMLQYVNSAMEMQNNMQDEVQASLASNPYVNKMMNLSPEDALSLFDDSPEVKEDSDLNEEETKAVLCGANLFYRNGQYINTLSTYEDAETILGGLEGSWGVTNKDELIETIEWLEKGGHRIYFNLIWNKFKSLPKSEWASSIKDLELEALNNKNLDSERLKEFFSNLLEGYTVLAKHGCFSTMKDPDITSWDYARAINLCRFGYDVEFFTREEALGKIKYFANKMYSIYDSWRSLSEGYLVGFAMWNGDADYVEELLEQHELLLTHEKSLWTKINW